MEHNVCHDKFVHSFLTCSVRGPHNWVWPKLCWEICTLWNCPFIHTHGLEIAIQLIPTLNVAGFPPLLFILQAIKHWSGEDLMYILLTSSPGHSPPNTLRGGVAWGRG